MESRPLQQGLGLLKSCLPEGLRLLGGEVPSAVQGRQGSQQSTTLPLTAVTESHVSGDGGVGERILQELRDQDTKVLSFLNLFH